MKLKIALSNPIGLAMAVVLITSFSFKAIEEKHQVAAFSFTIPHKWKISRELTTEDKWEYVSCKKKGLMSSGLVMIKCKKGSLDLEETLAFEVEKMEVSYNKTGWLNPSEIYYDTFNDHRAAKVDYTGNFLSLDHSGVIYCFHLCDHTVLWFKQGADEDARKNKAGFQELEASFTCVK